MPEATLDQFAEHRIWVQCEPCGREVTLDPAELARRYPGLTPTQLRRRHRCKVCGRPPSATVMYWSAKAQAEIQLRQPLTEQCG